jgi:hypothetical protein
MLTMFSTTIIIILGLSLVILSLVIHAFILEKRLKKLLQGKNGKDLESVIIDMQNRINTNMENGSKNSADINTLNQKMRKRIRNIQTMRFKPFEDAGSTQSFAIAIVDDEENGVVLSSLYTRERMSVFAKPITSGKSEYELTSEEKTVLESAKSEA